ncbi:MAG TPA: hypothetical protein VHF92_00840, partial [Geodermatophilus sp.]|nr:hypothetical protein [Geodermatophilus sp.]
PRGRSEAVSENRLTAEQLAALAPGDVVTIECGPDFGWRRHATGTVVRVEGAHIVVNVRTGRGATYQERYGRRDGVRVGALGADQLGTAGEARRVHYVDALYREWARNRTDVDRLRRLHAAIGECLEATSETVSNSASVR